jgi:transposase, IS30 family
MKKTKNHTAKKKNEKKSKKHYSHLSQTERDRIQSLFDENVEQKEIARIIMRDEGTVSREISRNRKRNNRSKKTSLGPYEAVLAERKAKLRRSYAKYRGKKIEESLPLRQYIKNGLKIGWSPDDISGRMKREKQLFFASKNAIYRWLYSEWGQYWCRYLYSKQYRTKKRKVGGKVKKTLIPNRISMEKRPKGATNKTRYGHYESDTIVSGKKTRGKSALTVTRERKTKFAMIRKIPNLHPSSNNNAILAMKTKVEDIKSMTFDNGIENTKHEELNIPTFFCHPYHSWEKGGVEHHNKMVRRYVPKGSNLDLFSEEYIMEIETLLNSKPRKSLRYQTPYEAMVEHGLLRKKKKSLLGIKKSPIALGG